MDGERKCDYDPDAAGQASARCVVRVNRVTGEMDVIATVSEGCPAHDGKATEILRDTLLKMAEGLTTRLEAWGYATPSQASGSDQEANTRTLG